MDGMGVKVTPVDTKFDRDWAREHGMSPEKAVTTEEVNALMDEVFDS